MAEIIKLNYDDGYKNIQLGDDPNRVIRINPTDAKFLNRMADFDVKSEKIREKYKDVDLNKITELQDLNETDPEFDKLKDAAETADQLDCAMKELINEIFGYDICKTVFGSESCLSPVNGQPLFINFMQCIFGYIAKASAEEKQKSQEKLNKYTEQRNAVIGLSK